MIGKKRVLALITARGGSKRFPRKNLAELGGKPLIAWTVAAAKASRHVDRVVLSSEDEAIIAAARIAGCEVPFRRPPELATDTASSVDVALDALERIGDGFDILVLLQPTSPLRTAEDIDRGLELMAARGTSSVVSVSPADKPPHWIFRIDDANHMHPAAEPPATGEETGLSIPMVLNGAIFVVDIPWFRATKSFRTPETLALEMPKERSVDIDAEWDLLLARVILERSRPGMPRG